MGIFSEALAEMDRNTVDLMIDEMQKKNDLLQSKYDQLQSKYDRETNLLQSEIEQLKQQLYELQQETAKQPTSLLFNDLSFEYALYNNRTLLFAQYPPGIPDAAAHAH